MMVRTLGLIVVCASTVGACKSGDEGSGGDTGSDSGASSSPTNTSTPGMDTDAPTTGDSATGGTTEMPDPTAGEFPCSPKASCEAAQPACIGLIDNTGAATYALRMSQLMFSKPGALTSGLLVGLLNTALLPDLPACNLAGQGTWSWLLQFDTGAGTLRTGAGLPMADPFAGYSFIDDANSSPAVMDAPVSGDGKFAAATGVDLVMPIGLGPGWEINLPMFGLLLSGTVSADQSCIGTFNAEGLDPANTCLADDENPTFVNGGTMSAHVLLTDADTIEIAPLGLTLCVLLSGDPATYGDGAKPISRCTRDADAQIVFKGDWCHSTNKAADAFCFDSVLLTADFAASSVKLN